MSIIDNKKVVFLDEIKKALPSAERLDIQTGYFFFSGFSATSLFSSRFVIRLSVIFYDFLNN